MNEGLKTKIYECSPVFLQNLAVSLVGWKKARQRYGGNFKVLLREALERDMWSHDQILEFQRQRLIDFVNFVGKNVPYYIRLFKSLGISPEDIKNPDDLKYLPILKKQTLQDYWKDFHPPGWKKWPLRVMQTSGTTGTGLLIHETIESHRRRWAVIWRYRMRHGLSPGCRQGLIVGHMIVPARSRKPPFWRTNLADNTVLFSSQHLSDRNIPHFIDEIARRELPWLHGYPSSLNLLALYMLEKDIRLPSVQWVTTGAESLLRNQKETIEQAFVIKVTDVYGLGESVASLAMCPESNYHVDEDFACTEFIPVPGTSNVWRIVGTNFTNPAFPLVRFDSNDLAVLRPGRCECGRPGRIVSEIIGRIEDYILTQDGARFRQPGFFFMGIMNIREGQMVQTAPDKIEFRIVRGPKYNQADEELLLKRARERIGDGIDYDFSYVDSIERSPGGKIKCLVSEIEDNEDTNPEDWLYKS